MIQKTCGILDTWISGVLLLAFSLTVFPLFLSHLLISPKEYLCPSALPQILFSHNWRLCVSLHPPRAHLLSERWRNLKYLYNVTQSLDRQHLAHTLCMYCMPGCYHWLRKDYSDFPGPCDPSLPFGPCSYNSMHSAPFWMLWSVSWEAIEIHKVPFCPVSSDEKHLSFTQLP